MLKAIPIRSLLLLGASAALSGCSLSGRGGDSSLYVDLSSLEGRGSRYALLNANGGFMGIAAANTAPPANPAQFACYGVNVTGPGIAESGHDNSGRDPMIDFYRTLNEANRYCSYRGVVTPPMVLNGGSAEAALQVPPGGLRLVQVVGVNDPVVCASGVLDDPAGSSGGGGRFYEIGRAVLNDVFGDRSVSVGMNWPTGNTTADDAARAARTMDCGSGGNCVTIDQFAVSAGSYVMPDSTYTEYAQRITATAGKYLKTVDLNLTAVATDTVAVKIMTSAVGAAAPTSDTGYGKTLTLPAGGGLTSVTFDIGTSGNYLMMQAGYDYWIVMGTSSASSVQWRAATSAASDVAKFNFAASPQVWESFSGHSLDYRVQACD